MATLNRKDIGLAALVLIALLIVFFWTPLTQGGYYLGIDHQQIFTITRVTTPDYHVKNMHVMDPAVQFIPFYLFNRELLSAGQLPIWNPYNGSGAPHLANYQSAVFSPFALPYYLLPIRAALIVEPCLKLFSLGFVTYLFLRLLALNHAAALLGAIAFMFGAFHIVWLLFPTSAPAIVLPASLLLAELLFRTSKAERRRRGLLLIGFTIVLAVGLLAGHPETYFFASLFSAAYLLMRIYQLKISWRERGEYLALFLASALVALLLAAVQLLPFIEYLSVSTIAAAREVGLARPFLEQSAVLQVFPNLLGNISTPYFDPAFQQLSYYPEYVGHYIGILTVFLATLAACSLVLRFSWHVAFFTISGLLWQAYAYDLGGINLAIHSLPLLNLVPFSRSQEIWLFSVSCLAALAAHDLLEGNWHNRLMRRGLPSRLLLTGLISILSGIVLGVAWIERRRLLEWAYLQPNNQVYTDLARANSNPHVIFIVATFLLGVVSLLLLAAMTPIKAQRPRCALLVSILAGLIFLQSGFLFHDYNPTIEDHLFYPTPPLLTEVLAITKDEQLLTTAYATMLNNANMVYKIRNLGLYDAIGIRTYETLYFAMLGPADQAHSWTVNPRSLRALQVMGVQYVATSSPEGFANAPDLPQVWSREGIYLYRVPNSLPRYYTVSSALTMPDDQLALQRLEQPDFDYRHSVILDSAAVNPISGSHHSVERIETREETPTRIRVAVERDMPGWFVALHSYYPGWRATVNGQSAPIYRANVGFRAVPIEAGRSEVVMDYDPLSVKLGLAISGLTLLGLGGLVVWRLWSGRLLTDHAEQPPLRH